MPIPGVVPGAKPILLRLDKNLPSRTRSFEAGEERGLLSLSGGGTAVITHLGNGSSGLFTRVYCDDKLEEIEATKAGMIPVSFGRSLKISAFSPTAGSFSTSDIYISGWIKY